MSNLDETPDVPLRYASLLVVIITALATAIAVEGWAHYRGATAASVTNDGRAPLTLMKSLP
jgi:hypothetical protein